MNSKKALRGLAIFALVLIIIAIIGLLFIWGLKPSNKPLAEIPLADGRTIRVEAITYGTNHVVGTPSPFVERYGPWLPRRLVQFLTPKKPKSTEKTDTPSLIIWTYAVKTGSEKFVDPQGVRAELVSEKGDVYQGGPGWFGMGEFSRERSLFEAYPRAEKTLRLRLTPWRLAAAKEVILKNPHVVQPEAWKSESLPLSRRQGKLEIQLKGLTLSTNGGPTNYWESRTAYWKPEVLIFENEQPATEWETPEWKAWDAEGNSGQLLGYHKNELKYRITAFPKPSHAGRRASLGKIPIATIPSAQTTNYLGKVFKTAQAQVELIGFFPPGTYSFTNGNFDAKPPFPTGPTRGSSPSGWNGTGRMISPGKMQFWNNHYTPDPVVYVKPIQAPKNARFAVLWHSGGEARLAKSDWPNTSGDFQIYPHLLTLPDGQTQGELEVVMIVPVEAEFIVKIPKDK